MSQTLSNHMSGAVPGDFELADPPRPFGGSDEAALLERMRDSLVRVIAEVDQHPLSVRVAVGAVSLEVEWAGDRPVNRVATASALSPPIEPPATAGPVLTSPTVGVFYRSPEPGAAPFVAEGDPVAVGQQIGIVEAMKLMIPVEADAAGVVAKVLKGDGEPVEYSEPLFALTTPA